jgi:hypothetical protein
MSGGGISIRVMSLTLMPRSFNALKTSRRWLEKRLGTATRLPRKSSIRKIFES